MVAKDEIKNVIDDFKNEEIEGVILLVKGKDNSHAYVNCSGASGTEMLVNTARQSSFFAKLLFSVNVVLLAMLNKEAETQNPDTDNSHNSIPEKA